MTFLQDGTGGLAVGCRAASTPAAIQPGVILQVVGQARQPVRQSGAARRRRPPMSLLLGRGGVPDPVTLTSAGLTETREGELARITRHHRAGRERQQRLARDHHPGQRRRGADLRLRGRRASPAERFARGPRLTATGIVGQRESASGVGDGYRLWPRDAGGPRPGGRATDGPARARRRPRDRRRPARPGTGDPSRSTVRIGSVRDGTTVTVQGTITAPAGLLDGEGRRVTIAGLQRRHPAALPRWRVGARRRYSRPGDRARSVPGSAACSWPPTAVPRTLGRTMRRPVVLRRAPGAADEWRLVRLTVRITDVARSGDHLASRGIAGCRRQPAHRGCGGSRHPVHGPRGGPERDHHGHRPTRVIQRRPTSASGSCRGASRDIELGRDPGLVGRTTRLGRRTPRRGRRGRARAMTRRHRPARSSIPPWTRSPRLAGRHVRVSGALRHVDSALLTIDDGSASALVRLLDGEATFQPPLASGEVLNVTGDGRRARRRRLGGRGQRRRPWCAPRHSPCPPSAPAHAGAIGHRRAGPRAVDPAVGGPTASTADGPAAAGGRPVAGHVRARRRAHGRGRRHRRRACSASRSVPPIGRAGRHSMAAATTTLVRTRTEHGRRLTPRE